MKNLQLLYNIENDIQIENPQILVLDANNSGSLFCSNKNEIFEYKKDTNPIKLCELKQNIVSIEHLVLNHEISIATESGEVFVLNVHNKHLDEVTFCEGGIQKMLWSPDQEVVAFITKSNLLVVMTSSYDPISESELDDLSAFGDGKFITVGWGKKETQFHGTEGKQAAKQKAAFHLPDNINELPHDINLSWRADGELFVVSFVCSYGRMFKVYNREGMLQFTSEKVNDLGETVSWRPSGNWIAVPHKLPNKYTVGLFEKNGLRHREIILPFQFENEPIKKLAWSYDSDILAIETIKDGNSCIYLYTIGNYHWYLKKFLSFDTRISDFVWDNGINEGKTLHILLQNGKYIFYRWQFAINYSTGIDENDQAVVAVIDGKNLLFTDFRNKIVPPPMFSLKLEHDTYINECAFLRTTNNDKTSQKLFIVDSECKLLYYNLEFERNALTNTLKSAKLENIQKYEKDLIRGVSQWLWINENQIVLCKIKENQTTIILANSSKEEIYSHITIDGIVGSLTNINDYLFIVNIIQGETIKFTITDSKIINSGLLYNEGEFCGNVQCIEHENSIKLFGLNTNNHLFINSIKISDDVTSFFVTRKYLVFTQLSSLKFFSLIAEKIVDERKIERGVLRSGKLITIVADDSRTILQMPRGNLEVINPRILSLDIVGKYLNNLHYKNAFEILRKQRINLNILFDHNPKIFIENLDRFLEEISNPQWLNLFLSDLQNENFTKTMYSSNYTTNVENYPENFSIESKISFVCENLCKKMEEKNYKQFILPIITSYIKVGNLEKALDIIWSEKKNEMNLIENINNDSQKSISEDALKYLLYLVDVNELYNIALGMYDFGLVLYVATKSQKDPKEYVPFLNELKKFDEHYRKFKIDLFLKRYEKALNNIAKCNDDKFDEALAFIEKESLYQKALLVYENQPNCYKQICLSFADHLRTQGKLINASFMYERAGDLDQALKCSKNLVDWHRCLLLTSKLHPGDKIQLKSMAVNLIVPLMSQDRYVEAYNILCNFNDDYIEGINCLIKGKLFLKAYYDATINCPDLIESSIIPQLKEFAPTVLTSIESDETTFLNYKNRLLTVRKLKADKENETDDGIDESDLLSDTTSMNSSRFTGTSRGTGKTFRSSKNRRKHERKILSLKEGNPFEDIALIDALHSHITKIKAQQNTISDTCKALIEIRQDILGRNIQFAYRKLLDIIKKSLDDIWIPEMQTNQAQITGPNIDYAQYQNEQHYALISPLKRIKPELVEIDWEHEVLK